MYSIVHTRKDLLIEESVERHDIINEIDTAFPYYFDSKQLINVSNIFLHNSNLLLLRSRKVDFIKELVNPNVSSESFLCFDNTNIQILVNASPTSCDKNVQYVISDMDFVNFNNSYILSGYKLSDVSLYGSALTYFRNKCIDEILIEL